MAKKATRAPRPAELRKLATKLGLAGDAEALEAIVARSREEEDPRAYLRGLAETNGSPAETETVDPELLAFAEERGLGAEDVKAASGKADPRRFLTRLARARSSAAEHQADTPPETPAAAADPNDEDGLDELDLTDQELEDLEDAEDEEDDELEQSEASLEPAWEDEDEEAYAEAAAAATTPAAPLRSLAKSTLDPQVPEIVQETDVTFVTVRIPVGDLQDAGYGISAGQVPRRIHERRLTHEQGVAAGRVTAGLYRDKATLGSGPWREGQSRQVSGIRDVVAWLFELIGQAIEEADSQQSGE